MDPTATLDMMRAAQAEARWEDADEHAHDLGTWLAFGGFEPEGMTSREFSYAMRAARVVLA